MSTFEDRALKGMASIVDSLERHRNEIDTRLDDIEKRGNRPLLGDGGGRNSRALAAEGNALRDYLKTDDARAFNSLSIVSDPDGGFLVHPELSKEIKRKLFDASPIRRLARVVEISTGDSFVEPVDLSDAEAAWVTEEQARPETNGGDLTLNRIPLDECYALVKVTQRLLDDSQFDVAGWITSKIADRFARLEGEAFIRGNGPHRPKGILSYGVSSEVDASRAKELYQYVPSGHATTITADAIIALVYSLRAPYRRNATILMNSDTGRVVRQLKDGMGNYLVVPGLALDQPDRLCGIPVVYDENMPNIAAGSYPIVIADWRRGYTVIERPGLKWLRDPYSAKPHVLMYATRRVGGQSSGDWDAAKMLKIGTS